MVLCPSGYIIAREGMARILVPDPKKYLREDGRLEPAWAPVFYNPEMTDNRTLTVTSIIAYEKVFGTRLKMFAEPLAGIGVRSIRVLLETKGLVERAFACDVNPLAVHLCRLNKLLNNISENLVVECSDANTFLLKLDSDCVPVDVVDIDPFGSPIYHVQPSVKVLAMGGLLIATATDLGVLEGKYPEVCLRRYGARIRRTIFCKELGSRVLIGSIARQAAMLDRGIKPLFVMYDRHYLKVVVEVVHSKAAANKTMSSIGFYAVSRTGDYAETLHYEELSLNNRVSDKVIIGPLWIGPLWDKTFVEELAKQADGLSSRRKKILEVIVRESLVESPVYYRVDKIFSKISPRIPPMKKIIEIIEKEGHRASRTHFDPMGIRTTMSYKELFDLLSRAFS